MACCKNDIGPFAHNKPIDTGLTADDAGMYELMFTGPNYARFTKLLWFEAGANIIIPQGILNEDFQYSLVITKPDGNALEVDDCPNFCFKTFVNLASCADVEYF